MTPRDLARIGQLILNNGAVSGRQVLPAQWLTECLTPRVSVDEQRRFGYQWYIGDLNMVRASTHVSIVGSAASVMVDSDCSSCLTSILSWSSPPGTTARRDQWIPPIRVMRDAVLASIKISGLFVVGLIGGDCPLLALSDI